jgi:predicted RNase H-like HicB family nuclease
MRERGKMRVINATFTINLPIRIQKEGGYYVSSCLPLDIFSQGETEKKAEMNLVEAIVLFINSCFQRGTIDKVLRQCGFIPMPATLKLVPKKPRGREIQVPVPLPFMYQERQAGCQG